MVYLRFTSLLLGLLLTLAVAIRVPTVLAGKEVTMTSNVQGVKEIGDVTVMIAGAQSRRLKGRKMGVKGVPKKELRNEVNTGKEMHSSNKSFGKPNTEDSSALEPADLSETPDKSQGAQVSSVNHPDSLGPGDEYQIVRTQKLIEANNEIFRMMNKDYRQKAHRRPPINNNVPLKDETKGVAP